LGFIARPAGTRLYLYGYNSDEVDLGGVTWQDPATRGKVQKIATSNRLVRDPECVGLPVMVNGAVMFRPNSQDPLSAVQGLRKRLIHERPPIDGALFKHYKKFFKRRLQESYRPLRPEEIPTYAEWREGVNHPEWRKKEYDAAYEDIVEGRVELGVLKKKKCFVKREFYPEPKFHRAIHSPTDHEKVLEGPFAKAIENQVFARPEYIKKIPRADWPAYIRDRVAFSNFRWFTSDYSSFEASFVPLIQLSTELKLVKFMLMLMLHQRGVKQMNADYKTKLLVSKLYYAFIQGGRSSGKMTTSVFNGVSNPAFVEFVLRFLCGATEVYYVVEGDDGLYAHNGLRDPTPADFLRLGLQIKLIPVANWYEASFCGVVTHPDVLDTLCDPWKVVLTCSWAGHNYIRAKDHVLMNLAQIKGLSYLAQYPGCPVVQSVALWILRVTKFDFSRIDQLLEWFESEHATTWWDSTKVRDIRSSDLSPHPVADGSRFIVASVFGVSIDIQLELESLFDHSTTTEVYLDPTWVDPRYSKHWNGFVREAKRTSRYLNVPPCLPEARYPENLLPWRRCDFDVPDQRFRTQIPV